MTEARSVTTASLDRELRDLVEAERERLHIPGVAVGVIHGDDEWYAGFGVTNVEAPSPVDDGTLFQIGHTQDANEAYAAAVIGFRLIARPR